MRLTATVILLGFLAVAGGARGETRAEFRSGLLFGQHFGESKYELDFVFGGSELVFPLDVTKGGVELGWHVVRGNRTLWIAQLRLQTALNDPGGKFTDKDWINMAGGGRLEFSNTRSTVEGSLVELELEVARYMTGNRNVDLYFLIGAGYQKIKQRAVDLVGSQLVSSGDDWIAYVVSYDGLALTYEIRYIRPQIGLMPRFRLSRSFKAEFKAVVSPFMHAKDIDDHVLRVFQVRTDGKGFGYAGRLALAYERPGPKRLGFFIRLAAETVYGKIDMTGFRRYYGDNPVDEASAGDQFPVATTVTTTQYSVRLQLGLRF